MLPVTSGGVVGSLLWIEERLAAFGAPQSGLGESDSILCHQSALDRFPAIIFTSILGLGVGLEALPMVLYEGSIGAATHLSDAALLPGMLVVVVLRLLAHAAAFMWPHL